MRTTDTTWPLRLAATSALLVLVALAAAASANASTLMVVRASEPVIADVSLMAGPRNRELAGTSMWIGDGARTVRLRSA